MSGLINIRELQEKRREELATESEETKSISLILYDIKKLQRDFNKKIDKTVLRLNKIELSIRDKNKSK